MNIFISRLVGAAVVAVALSTAIVARAQFTGTAGFDYSTGKYGESSSTDILYVPAIARYDMDAWTFKLTVPYIHVSGPGNVIQSIGPIRTRRTITMNQTESGLGDVIAAANYDFYTNKTSGLTLGVTGKVKFGTASSSRGLGTGENDYFLQLDASRPFGDFTPFGSFGYRVVGNPSGANLKNIFYGSVGSAYKLDQANTVGASLDLRQKISDTGDAAEELTGFVTHKFDQQWRVQAYALTGFTNASPDIGAGALVSYSF